MLLLIYPRKRHFNVLWICCLKIKGCYEHIYHIKEHFNSFSHSLKFNLLHVSRFIGCPASAGQHNCFQGQVFTYSVGGIIIYASSCVAVLERILYTAECFTNCQLVI